MPVPQPSAAELKVTSSPLFLPPGATERDEACCAGMSPILVSTAATARRAVGVLPWLGLVALAACVANDPAANPEKDPESTTSGQPTDGVDTESTGAEGEDGLAPAAFVAIGEMGRSVISCDLGRTWQRSRSFDVETGHAFQCGEPGPVTCGATSCRALDKNGFCNLSPACDCSTHPGASRGVALTDSGASLASWGKLFPGPTMLTADGDTWTTLFEEPRGAVGGVAYGNGVLALTVSGLPPVVFSSSDDGLSWQEAALPSGAGLIRDAEWVDVAGGTFVVRADDALVLSHDGGSSWFIPPDQPKRCLGADATILGGGDSIVLLGSSGFACTSTDRGLSWSTRTLDTAGVGAWTGSMFAAYDQGVVYTSEDGELWDRIETPGEPAPAVVRADPVTGVAVGVNARRDSEQRFMRSNDGIHWDALAPETFTGGHRISHIGVGPGTALCAE